MKPGQLIRKQRRLQEESSMKNEPLTNNKADILAKEGTQLGINGEFEKALKLLIKLLKLIHNIPFAGIIWV